MSHPMRFSLILLAILLGLLLVWGVVQAAPLLVATGAEQQASALPTPTTLPKQPEVFSPDISFIDSPTATCSLLRAHSGACQVNWYYMYASADPNYIITMTVGIDNKLRARYQGFFQTDMFVPSDLLTFEVPCGEAGSGGDPMFGEVYNYTLRARDSTGLSAANYGAVTCPADAPYRTFLSISRR